LTNFTLTPDSRELAVALERDHLTRQQLANRLGISLDRVIQWLALLKLPKEKLEEITVLGDYWDRRVVTRRELRRKGGALDSLTEASQLIETERYLSQSKKPVRCL
jgi:hypothetical protein